MNKNAFNKIMLVLEEVKACMEGERQSHQVVAMPSVDAKDVSPKATRTPRRRTKHGGL